MPNTFELISQYFWLLCLVFGALSYLKARMGLPAESASEEIGYLRKFAFGVNLPWLVMAAGQISGYTPTVWYYFRPQDGNPFVVAWLAVIFAASCVYAWWVWFGGCAEKVRDLNLTFMLGHRSMPVGPIKLLAAVMVFMLPVWVYMVMSFNVPLPDF